MAHAYTTARGKTKKQKESVRKDAKNNAATKLMSSIKREAPKKQEDVVQIDFTKKIMGLSSGAEKKKTIQEGSVSLEEDSLNSSNKHISNKEAILESLRRLIIYIPTYQRCFYSECTNFLTNPLEFKLCGKCRISRYCSPECQKIDWKSIHKEACCKTNSTIEIGSSVAIRSTDQSLVSTSVYYPTKFCISPANEQHGIISSLSPLKIEIFDCDLVSTGIFVEGTLLENIVITQWNLENERKYMKEKMNKKEETKKEEMRKIQQKINEISKQKAREAKARKIIEKNYKEKNGSNSLSKQEGDINWSLFTEDELSEIDKDLEDGQSK